MKGLAVMLCSALAACGPTSGVDWSRYDPSVKQSIDRAAAARDCQALQDAFNVAASRDSEQRARTGEGSGALMTYIDQRMTEAGCSR